MHFKMYFPLHAVIFGRFASGDGKEYRSGFIGRLFLDKQLGNVWNIHSETGGWALNFYYFKDNPISKCISRCKVGKNTKLFGWENILAVFHVYWLKIFNQHLFTGSILLQTLNHITIQLFLMCFMHSIELLRNLTKAFLLARFI